MDHRFSSFQEKLEQEHEFPGIYIFKFIAPSDKIEMVKELLPSGKLSSRQSSNNNYTSLTLKARVQSSQEVVEVYLSMQDIKGVIAL